VASVLLCPLGWTYYYWLPLGPMLALMVAWRQERSAGTAGWGRLLFCVALPGLFWPVQLTSLFQPYPLATLLIGNLNFWTVFAIWLGLALDAWAARSLSPVGRSGPCESLVACP